MILAIETALKSGSISILNGEEVVCSRVFGAEISMSQHLVGEIDQLLKISEVDKTSLNLIAISNGPGSLTGIRIGISVGMGLAYSLGIECAGISLLQAFRLATGTKSVISIVPAGKEQSYWQLFAEETSSSINLIKNEEVAALAQEYPQSSLVVYNDLFVRIKEHISNNQEVIIPINAAELIGWAIQQVKEIGSVTRPSPIYLQEHLFKKTS